MEMDELPSAVRTLLPFGKLYLIISLFKDDEDQEKLLARTEVARY
jgi:hypothetical protein